jgi:hypothetical protein
MSDALPESEVFLDVSSIKAGVDFRAAIADRIARSSIVLTLIGPRWLGEGRLRIFAPDDLVRFEIATALTQAKRIIPILVNNAQMPEAEEMPDDVAGLRALNAVELRHSRFDDDFANLMRAVTGRRPASADRPARRYRLRWWLGPMLSGAAIGAIAAQTGLILHYHATGKALSERVGEDGALLIYPLAVLAGALIGYWHGRRRERRWGSTSGLS